MKSSRLLLVLITFLPVAVGRAEPDCPCECAAAKPVLSTKLVAAANETAPARHPLRGVVIEVLADKSALLVKHEDIPGVMKAMTMLLKVDTAALTAVQKGSRITGLLVKHADGWWLEAVQPAK
ncbi:MAG: copper-binding protein [Opitutus sp.]|nr:copper-binding protein [Opitutus sp.]MCS6246243.1 copper-binding protein [Opitutus sp.]MCS6274108.1 copper-binding protein [Opitutus sp.]MCS6277250.1 copper-binding protein [Opitutus sp.]MCS6300372.1 copper-binding protein [Opitutus sp.]